jgi:hypothetical protein
VNLGKFLKVGGIISTEYTIMYSTFCSDKTKKLTGNGTIINKFFDARKLWESMDKRTLKIMNITNKFCNSGKRTSGFFIFAGCDGDSD